MVGKDGSDGKAVFERTKLFERFGLFERCRCHLRIRKKEVATICIDTDMLIDGGFTLNTRIRDERAREVERIAFLIRYAFDRVRIGRFFRIEFCDDGRHLERFIFIEEHRESVDDIGRDERFVALYVDDDVGIGIRACYFRQTVCSCRMVGRGHHDDATEFLDSFFYERMVGRNEYRVRYSCLTCSFVYSLDHRFARNISQRFARQTRRCVSCRNDTQNVHCNFPLTFINSSFSA